MSKRRIALALVHHPVLDRQNSIITTAITNLDLHDIARSACAYGLTDVFIVHPITVQRELAERVREHWLTGSGAKRIPDRAPPMRLLRVADSLADAYRAYAGGRDQVEVWTTSAKSLGKSCTYAEAKASLHRDGLPVMMLFGTGWGLAPHIVSESDVLLEPIRAREETGFNHLSVRAACAISLDRLLGV